MTGSGGWPSTRSFRACLSIFPVNIFAREVGAGDEGSLGSPCWRRVLREVWAITIRGISCHGHAVAEFLSSYICAKINFGMQAAPGGVAWGSVICEVGDSKNEDGSEISGGRCGIGRKVPRLRSITRYRG